MPPLPIKGGLGQEMAPVNVLDILITVMVSATAVILSIFAYIGWAKYRRHQLRRSMRY